MFYQLKIYFFLFDLKKINLVDLCGLAIFEKQNEKFNG